MSMARAGGAIGKATGVIESMKTKTTAEATHTPMGITRTGKATARIMVMATDMVTTTTSK
jgi:hypothetical protein